VLKILETYLGGRVSVPNPKGRAQALDRPIAALSPRFRPPVSLFGPSGLKLRSWGLASFFAKQSLFSHDALWSG